METCPAPSPVVHTADARTKLLGGCTFSESCCCIPVVHHTGHTIALSGWLSFVDYVVHVRRIHFCNGSGRERRQQQYRA